MAENTTFIDQVRQWPVGIRDYFQELQMEMRRVTWPSKSQVQATTLVVIVTVFIFAAYFFVVDAVFLQFIGKLFKVFSKQT
jgi:preprotein translocase subunit SecE